MILFWPIGAWIWQWRRVIRAAATSLLLIGAASLTRNLATLWSQPLQQAVVWAELTPESPRAQAYAIQVQAEAGMVVPASRRAAVAAARFPNEPQVAFAKLDVDCQTSSISEGSLSIVAESLRTTSRDPGPLFVRWFTDLSADIAEGRCPALTFDILDEWLDVAATNPALARTAGRRQDLYFLRGWIELARGNPAAAFEFLKIALAEQPNASAALGFSATLGRANAPELGLALLDSFACCNRETTPSPSEGMPWIHMQVLRHQHYWDDEIKHLRMRLQEASGSRSR
jgi:hypothetical protein